jgi:PAS domain S-box-containing protein
MSETTHSGTSPQAAMRRRDDGEAPSDAADAPGGSAVVDAQMRLVQFTERARELLGLAAAYGVGRTLEDAMPAELFRHVQPLVSEALSGAAARRMVEWQGPSGRMHDLDLHILPGSDWGGDARQVLLVVADASERRRLARRLETKDRITMALSGSRTIGEAAPLLLKALCAFLGCRVGAIWLVHHDPPRLICKHVHSPDAATRQQFWETCSALSFERGEHLLGSVWAAGEPIFISDVVDEPTFMRSSLAATEGFSDLLAYPIALQGRVLGVLEFFFAKDALGRDPHFHDLLTAIVSQIAQFIERRRGEEALRESERRLLLLTDVVPQLIWTADATGRVDFYSRRHSEYAGFRRNEDGSWDWSPVVHPDDSEATVAAWETAVRTGEVYEIEHRIGHIDGGFRWHLSRAIPMKDDMGKVTRWYGSATDIDALKTAQTEAERLLSERQALLDTMAQGLAVVARDGRTTFMNRVGRRTFGFAPDGDLPDFGEIARAMNLRTLDGTPLAPDDLPEARSLRGEAVSGQEVIATVAGRDLVLRYDGAALRTGDGRVAEAIVTFDDITEKQKTEQALRKSEAHLRATFDNVADAIVIRSTVGEVIDLNPAYANLHGFSDIEAARLSPAQHAQLFEFRSSDGRTVPEEEQPFAKAIRGDVVRELELHVVRRRTGELGFIGSYSAVPVRDERGDIFQVVITIRDVTQRRQAEHRHDLLTREVNHRARNALAVVQAITRLTKAETVEEYGEGVRRRVETLVRSHARLADHEWQEVPLADLILDELRPYASGPEDRIEMDGAALSLVAGAVQPLSMALHELATNAAKYGALSVPEGRVRIVCEAPGGGMLRLVWTERGGPQTTAPERRGLGSTVIESVADQLGGSVEMDWEPDGLRCVLTCGKGTVAASGHHGGAPTSLPRDDEGGVPGGSGKRILVVEDDALLAADLAETLRELGYIPIGPAATLDEAIRLASASEAPPDAAVLDVNVNGRMSWPVADSLIERNIPVIFTTGYGQSDEIRARNARCVQKPYTAADLEKALCEAIGLTAAPST